MKRIHLICNAHLDPVWQWEWEEGAAAAVSTFRCAADFCEEFDDFVFCHNEALLYKWVEEYEPALFARIQKLVSLGKWHIMGGWHLQPDCNMPSGESFVRQIQAGRAYFKAKFNAAPTTAINFDPFGHTRGLVQILAKSGYDSYMFCRPDNLRCPLPADAFTWVGYDGSTITGRRINDGYNSGLGQSAGKIKAILDRDKNEDFTVCLWGVGDHGGGASREDLREIRKLRNELKEQGIEVIHSTPENYFAELKQSGALPEHCGDLNPWAVGCYTSQIRIKQKHRLLEAMLYATERMCVHAMDECGLEYPEKELEEAQYDLLTSQFHDSLPGSSVSPVEEAVIRQLDHGLEILSRVRARMFFALAAGQRKAAADEIPVLVYNPHPYPVEGDFECEFMLWDQNWKDEFSNPVVYCDGKRIPSQCEKENSNIPLDWRKRVVFHATLAPMQMNRFDCKIETLPQKPKPLMPSSTDSFVFEGAGLHAEISRRTGLINGLSYNGKALLAPEAFRLEVMADTADPWGMTVNGWTDKIGEFTLLSDEESKRFSNVDSPLPPVRIIEDGAVRTTVEAVFGYGNCRAVLTYRFGKCDGKLSLGIRIVWDEKAKTVKLRIPTLFENLTATGEVAYGEEPFKADGSECVSQRYITLSDGENSVAVINNGTYGSSLDGNALRLTLLRSAAYTAHPIGARKITAQDRHSPYMEQGERLYSFMFAFGKSAGLTASTPRAADSFNEAPMALSFFPSGDEKLPTQGLTVTGSNRVRLSSFKRAADGNGVTARLFNPSAEDEAVTVSYRGRSYTLNLRGCEISTLRIANGTFTLCDLCENTL